MDYILHMGAWNSVFAVPTSLVDRYLKLAGKEQLQVLLWMLRHGGEAVAPETLARELGTDVGSVLDALDYWVQEGLLTGSKGELSPAAAQEPTPPICRCACPGPKPRGGTSSSQEALGQAGYAARGGAHGGIGFRSNT